ncbi:MAG: FtsX-like permease family protein [Lachnospiraceae bacterium]
MQKVLLKRVIRDFRQNLFRYLALAALIILGMYMVVGLVAAADTIILGTEKEWEENKLEDGQFSVFVPLTRKEEESLREDGIVLEKMFYLDFQMKDKSVLRVFKNREEINRIDLDEGRLAEGENEVVLEKRYCSEHDLHIGDKVTIAGHSYEITGIGSVPDYDAPYKNMSDSSVDSGQFGIAFVKDTVYEMLKDSGKSSGSEAYYYAYRLEGAMTDDELKDKLKKFTVSPDNIEDAYFNEYWENKTKDKEELEDGIDELAKGSKELSDALSKLAASDVGKMIGADSLSEGGQKLYEGVSELQDYTDELIDTCFDETIDNLTAFVVREDNPRIGAGAEDQVINKVAGLIAGVIVMILFTYVISVFVIHSIDRESSVIGALYALGVKKRDLMIHYLMLPAIITFAAGVIGTLLGFSKLGVNFQMRDCYLYYSLPDLPVIYPAYLIVYSMVMPVLVALLVNCIVIQKRLSKPVLGLIKNEQKSGRVYNLRLKQLGFIRTFQIRQMLREARTSFTVVFGMFISLLIMMLGVDCYVMCNHISEDNKADTKYKYMYTYKYPEEKVPNGGEACFAKTLKKEVLGYNLDVTLFGIDEENSYFDVSLPEGKTEVVISDAMAAKYQLREGDQVVLSDEENEMEYAFTIAGITKYSVGMYAFMDIDSMRELLGEEEDYYNVVLSDHKLDIETGRLYAATSKEDIDKASDVFVNMMMPMVIMMCSVSAIIFCVVMYLMMKVMIDRSSFHISLIKIFGYRTGEVRKLYLNGNFYIVAVGAAICIPLSKLIMDKMYPYMVSNVACGMNLTFDFQLYIIIYLAIILCYLVINQMLVGRLKKMVPAEVLKNRE